MLDIASKRTEATQEMSSNSSTVATAGPNTQKRRPHANPPKREQSKENAEIDDDLIWARGPLLKIFIYFLFLLPSGFSS